MEQKKDYSLLRPFDLEAAKRGEPICYTKEALAKYIAGPNSMGTIVVQWDDDRFNMTHKSHLRMAPLAWVEGKPVYKGDVLWFIPSLGGAPRKVTITGFNEQEGFFDEQEGFFDTEEFGRNTCSPGRVTWTPPKVKREGFVCVVKAGKAAIKGEFSDVIVRNGSVFPTREAAQAWADRCQDVIAIAPVEWEEPAGQEGGAA